MEVETLIKEIKAWLLSDKVPKNFDDSFVTSLMSNYKKYGSLTEKQGTALKNMHAAFVLGEGKKSAQDRGATATYAGASQATSCTCKCHSCANYRPIEKQNEVTPDYGDVPF